AKEINRFKDNNMTIANELAAQLRQLANILGLLTKNSEEFLQNRAQIYHINDTQKIELLVKKRNDARRKKLWILADSLRHKLNKMNVILEDNLEGTSWHRK
ncbi:MAG: DALR domain-containing protein, partial [Arsenophonus sp. ET-DL12-MAG3]